MSPKNSTTIDVTVTSAYDLMSVDNTDDKLVIIRSQIDNPKLSSQPAYNSSSYSSYTPRTASTYALSPSAALPADLTSFPKFTIIYNQCIKVFIGFVQSVQPRNLLFLPVLKALLLVISIPKNN